MSNKLLNEIMQRHKLKTDTQLAEFLLTSSPSISNLRAGRKGPSPDLILKIYDRAGMSIEEIRQLAKE